jgi:hypothetical protein
MNTQPPICVGPHAYRVVQTDQHYRVEYNLYHAQGWRERPAEGKPNAHGWKLSKRCFPATWQGAQDARTYARHLLRPFDRSEYDCTDNTDER